MTNTTTTGIDTVRDNPGVVGPPPLIYAGTLVAGLLLNLAFPRKFVSRVVGLILGGLCIAIASVILPSAFRQMRAAKTNINPTQPATTIVTEGPFRFTRNPLYLSMTLLYAGIALVANALWAMLLLPIVLIVMNFGVIDREERYLERKFGEQYLHYKRQVRRWI